ncbi:hypothetical protein [uncultured Draconibacterium sp.]|uniref:hypothetical protein n=1 Tax=uncultured Draconibacterium sp. TaxID=1573823 RepID=UPI0025FA0623|nr:hypothetical protein [uncultured Draconibacterium sp.]
MGVGKIDASTVFTLFEELKQKIDKLGNGTVSGEQTKLDTEEIAVLLHEFRNQVKQTQFSTEQLRILQKNMVTASTYTIREVGKNLSAVKRELKATISPINERIDQLKIPKDVIVRKEHHIRIDFRNSKAVITIISMALAILLLLGGNVWQLNTNGKLRDNDLKYRYIKLKGEVDTKVLSQLESIFTYNRDRDVISKIRKQVKSYEQMVREHAEEMERERFGSE